jgi:hypothetical protein
MRVPLREAIRTRLRQAARQVEQAAARVIRRFVPVGDGWSGPSPAHRAHLRPDHQMCCAYHEEHGFWWFCQRSRQQGPHRVFLHAQPPVFTRHARGRRFHIPPQKASLARTLTEPLTAVPQEGNNNQYLLSSCR